MPELQLPERCESCPFFMQTFIQELKRKTDKGVRQVEMMTGLCGAMRLSEIRAKIPKHETTHRRAGDSSCYFSSSPDKQLSTKVAWLVDKRRTLASGKGRA